MIITIITIMIMTTITTTTIRTITTITRRNFPSPTRAALARPECKLVGEGRVGVVR